MAKLWGSSKKWVRILLREQFLRHEGSESPAFLIFFCIQRKKQNETSGLKQQQILSKSPTRHKEILTFIYWAWVACINCIYASFSEISAHGPKKMKKSVITRLHPQILLVRGTQRPFSTVERLNHSRGSAHNVFFCLFFLMCFWLEQILETWKINCFKLERKTCRLRCWIREDSILGRPTVVREFGGRNFFLKKI